MQNFSEYKAFLKHPDWKIHTKSKDGSRKLYTRISSKPLFCVKSISVFREDPLVVSNSISDTTIKQKYDETFDYGTAIYPQVALDCGLQHFYFKKVLVVSPRDMIVFSRHKVISNTEHYFLAKSFDNDELFPQTKGIVRAASPISGWRIQIKEPGDPENGIKPLMKVTFFSEADFKISLFISKSVGPKSGHLSNALANFLVKA